MFDFEFSGSRRLDLYNINGLQAGCRQAGYEWNSIAA